MWWMPSSFIASAPYPQGWAALRAASMGPCSPVRTDAVLPMHAAGRPSERHLLGRRLVALLLLLLLLPVAGLREQLVGAVCHQVLGARHDRVAELADAAERSGNP